MYVGGGVYGCLIECLSVLQIANQGGSLAHTVVEKNTHTDFLLNVTPILSYQIELIYYPARTWSPSQVAHQVCSCFPSLTMHHQVIPGH